MRRTDHLPWKIEAASTDALGQALASPPKARRGSSASDPHEPPPLPLAEWEFHDEAFTQDAVAAARRLRGFDRGVRSRVLDDVRARRARARGDNS